MSKQINLDLVLKIISNQIESLKSITRDLEGNLSVWKSKTIRLLQGKVVDEELSVLNDINMSSYRDDQSEYIRFMEQLLRDVEVLPEEHLIKYENNSNIREKQVPKKLSDTDNIFIVHGHDDISKLEVARTIEKLGLTAIVLHEQPN